MQLQIDQALEVLTQTPDVLNALLRGKSPAWLNCRKSPESFNAIDVLGHLMHAEQTDWIPRIQIILDHQATRAFDPFDRFAFQPLIASKPVEELLAEFAEQRRLSLQTLRDLDLQARQLTLPGLHPELGPVTLANLLAAWVVHDLGHISQIMKTMAGEYRDAVGPWRPYVTFLD
jgi:uncharacterized damage-inducible protein DinB